jgi:uncharacterized protein DUF6894
MHRFFFNYRERNEYTVDDTGIEFDTFELAYLDAFNTAREMWPEVMARRVDPRACAFEILDSRGNLLALLNFKELLENCEDYPRGLPLAIEGTFARVADTAQRTRQKLAEFQQELDRTRGRLDAVKQLVRMM